MSLPLHRFKQERVLSSAGSEHLPYKQRVGGSNPSAPTRVKTLNPEDGLGVCCFLSINHIPVVTAMITQEQLKETFERKLALRRYL